MTKGSRMFAGVAAAVICVVLLFSTFFIAVEAGHTCIDNQCEICYQISHCEKAIKSLVFAVLLVAALMVVPDLCEALRGMCFADRRKITLITLKVKLSN